MKKIIKILTVSVFLTAIPFTMSAQNPPPPNGGSNPTGSNTPVGGGAPIGGGLLILIGLGAAYGGRKIYEIRKRSLLE